MNFKVNTNQQAAKLHIQNYGTLEQLVHDRIRNHISHFGQTDPGGTLEDES